MKKEAYKTVSEMPKGVRADFEKNAPDVLKRLLDNKTVQAIKKNGEWTMYCPPVIQD
jgi:hypothetical protein